MFPFRCAVPVIMLAFVPTLRAEEPAERPTKDPLAVFQRSDIELRKVDRVHYEATLTRPAVEGGAKSKDKDIEGKAYAEGWDGDGPARYRYEFRLFPGGGDKPERVEMGRDGGKFYVIRHGARTVHVGQDASVFGLYAIPAKYFSIPEFVHPQPLADEMKSPTQQFVGVVTTSGEECNVVRAYYASGTQEVTWHFAIKDGLPRAVERLFLGPAGERSAVLVTINKLEVNPKVEPASDPLEFRIPDGYTKADGKPGS